MGEIIEFRIGHVETAALVAFPASPSAKAGVVVSFNHNGFDASTRSIVDGLAKAGFFAIAPNHYHVMPAGVDIERRREYLSDHQFATDLQAAFDWLVSKCSVDPKRIALVGHCQGGRAAWVGVTTSPELWACACVWYGGGAFRQSGDCPSPYERLHRIECPVMGFFGNADNNPSPADVDKFEERLTATGKQFSFHRYDGAGHGFMNFNNPNYHPAASEHSWRKATEFLRSKLLPT